MEHCLAASENAPLIDNIVSLRVVPGTDMIHGIDLCTQFVSYWDSDFRLVELNNSLFFDGMCEHEGGKDFARGRFILDYLPDLESMGVWGDCKQLHAGSVGRFDVPAYRFKGFNLNKSVRCTMKFAKLGDYTVITGEDILWGDSPDSLGCALLRQTELERSRLSTTVDVLAARFASLKQEQERAAKTNLETEVMPLLSMLASTRLDKDQQLMVSTIRQCLESILDDHDARLASSEATLSFREREVAALVNRGKTAKEIAVLLGISTRTVETHKANIQRKLKMAAS
ncbi:MAG: hypothetical protein IJJ14_03640 [Coriobacteriales bacterium]|nr:hypothetical protein [Coriobacteriales bacterium]